MRNAIIAVVCSFVISSVFAQDIPTIWEDLPNKDKYGYIKKNSIGSNLSVFKQYEAQKSHKVIYICMPNFFSFRVHAYWEVDEIKNKADAEKFAEKDCTQSSSRYALLGYSIGKDFKY